MTSTPSSRLRLAKQAPGDNFNAWGTVVNSAVIDMVDEAFGFIEIAVNANVTLTSNNYTSDQSRRAVLRFTGAGGFTVIVPGVDKLYHVDNRCAADVTLKTAGGASAVIRAGTRVPVYIDTVDAIALDPTLDKIKPAAAAVDLNGQRLINAGAATADTDLIQRGQVATLSSGFVDLARNWATQASGEVVTGQGFSALFNANLAKSWATKPSGEVVAGQGFSSFYYAGQSAGSASASATSAGNSAVSATLSMNWATSLALVDGTYFGARKYAIDAAASATAAATYDPATLYTTTAADIRSNASGKLVNVNALWASQAFTTTAYASTVTLDGSTFLNTTISMTGNLTLANPINMKAGQSGFIRLVHSGAARTVAFGSVWKLAGGTPTASITAGVTDAIAYLVVADGGSLRIEGSYLKGIAA